MKRMGSPLGGFYIASVNRSKNTRHRLDSRLKLNIGIELYIRGSSLLCEKKAIFAHEPAIFQNARARVAVEATPLSSSLLQIKCKVEETSPMGGKEPVGVQVINLEWGETVTSLVEGNSDAKIQLGLAPV